MTTCRGVRGATTVETNEAEVILAATRELLQALVEANHLRLDDLASGVFSLTADLDAAFPATAARQLGWEEVALLDVQEAAVPGSLPRCIRVLLHWNTDRPASEIVHVYLRGARALRPDRARGSAEERGSQTNADGHGWTQMDADERRRGAGGVRCDGQQYPAPDASTSLRSGSGC